MSSILFLTFPTISHLNATFPLAHVYQRDGVKVYYANVGQFLEKVTECGFEYYCLDNLPFGLGLEKVFFNHQKKVSYTDILLLKFTDALLKKRKKAVEGMLNEIKPEVIFIDQFCSTDFLLCYEYAKQYRAAVIFFQTTFPSYSSSDYPPITSAYIPGQGHPITDRIRIQLLWLQHQMKVASYRLLQKAIFFGYDDSSSVQRYLHDSRLKGKYSINTRGCLHLTFTNIPEVIIAPQELDFPAPASCAGNYLGNLVYTNPAPTTNVAYSKIKEYLLSERAKGRKIVYCSFGSRYHAFRGRVKQFLMELFPAIAEMPNVEMIVSVKDLNMPCPKNVHVLDTVPQLDVLRFADVFTTHGGLNSIKEAISAGVPMLVYPLDKDSDQPGNGARVAFHKLGLHGDLASDCKDDILQKLQRLFAVETNDLLASIQQKLQQKYTNSFIKETVNRAIEQSLAQINKS